MLAVQELGLTMNEPVGIGRSQGMAQVLFSEMMYTPYSQMALIDAELEDMLGGTR
jgi:hypothetical protein